MYPIPYEASVKKVKGKKNTVVKKMCNEKKSKQKMRVKNASPWKDLNRCSCIYKVSKGVVEFSKR